MTPKEIAEQIEANRRALRDAIPDQLRERERRTFVLEEPEDIPDDQLPVRRYEPQDLAQAQEIP